ncbi:MAG TPA: tRNA (adenosine(37)-N6)-threonylcarbamoyltransferase complex ATPase subunit type 1 TsaE [Acholeplasmataceae bacterium]|nr:tRNA (adenosine(37)-N6)-threonylcarbamoyltransferase complex ATPase subunit type 1 TsaE [Acholeplasmataceae bacterium]
MKKEIILNSIKETISLGEKLGKRLEKNMVICLEGDLGAGKTTFTKGIALGLDIFAVVNSPTFVIMKIYNGRLPLYHLDVYRLNNESGDDYLVEYFEAGGVSVVEWADNISELLPNEYLKIVIKDLGDEKRKFIFESNSTTYDKLIERVI